MLQRCFVFILLFYALNSIAQSQAVLTPPVVTIAIEKTPTSFNPFVSKELFSQQFKHLFFDPLFRWGTQNKLEMRLVEHWERIDNKTVRFHLRPDIHFHSGNLLTSKDVIWSFQEAKKQTNSVFFSKIESIKQRNKYSFDIRSTLTNFQLFDYLTYVFILDSDFYKNNMALLNPAASILLPPIEKLPISGTGPYQIYKFNPILGIEVIANEHYWGQVPEMKHLRFMRIKNAQSRLFALLADDVQVSYSVPNKNVHDLSRNSGKHLIKVPSSNAIFLTINDKLSPVLHNREVRKAIRLAIDQQSMLKNILNNSGRVNNSFMTLAESKVPEQMGKMCLAPPEYDLNKAKKMLKNVKLPKQMSMLVMLDNLGNSEQVANALSYMLNQIGIKLVIQKTGSKDLWNKTNLYYDFTVTALHTRLMSRENVYSALFSNSFLTNYLKNKFSEENIVSDFQKKSEYFESLQRDDWVIPLLFQDQVWVENGDINLQDIFSTNSIPYWSLLKMETKAAKQN
ncbi:ABC transporter substrate-binding protein [Psychromonas sp. RZ22]|uniref:ABC transporter substrate-binding protein n=1 Tax=Psychromonas algarum TaxID=2555643 RepID=UPI0010680862|nr:ABC transporter substrate-binding protein [Psychromonas sp. RZ22]TEW54994.1 ABC transporter substrate-binding protein [Psychromonas sp. RZ22]